MTAYSFSDMHSVSDNPEGLQSKPVKKDDARSRILKTALTEFAQRGYEGVSTTEIAKSAGVTQPLIHYHFKSKDALWKASVEEIFGWLQDDFMGMADILPTAEDPEAMIRLVVRKFVVFCGEHPEFGQFIVREGTQRSERLDWLINEWMMPSLSKFADTQKRGVDEGWFKDIPFAQLASVVASVSTLFFALGPMFESLFGVDTNDRDQMDAYCNTVVDMVTNLIYQKVPSSSQSIIAPEIA